MRILEIFTMVCLLVAMSCTIASAQGKRDIAQEEKNLARVTQFYDLFLNKHQVDEAGKFLAESYDQHNPNIPGGRKGVVGFLHGFLKVNPDAKVRIVRGAAHGDIVWLHVHVTRNAEDRGMAIVDIFRLEDGLIAEHWDVIQEVPEKSINGNTMF